MAGGGLGNIGSASVSVEADFTRFYADLAAQRRGEVEVDVNADTTQAQAEIDALDGETVTVDVEANTKPFERQVERQSDRSGKDGADAFARAFGNRIRSLNLGSRIFGQIKPAAFIGGVGLAAQAASAASVGVLALVGSLSALSGSLVALPASMGAVAQGMGVFKLATSGVTDALGGLNEAADPDKIAELTPPAQEFVRILDKLKPGIIDFQTALQGGLFPGLTRSIRTLIPALEQLRVPLVGTARTLGILAENAASAVAAMIGPIRTLVDFNNELLLVLGRIGIELGRSFVTILVAARPLVLFMANAVLGLASAISGDLQRATSSGGLALFFGRARESLTKFTKLLGSLGSVLGSILGAAQPFGNELLRILNVNTRALADFLNTPKGQDSLRQFFAGAMPAILEIGRLIRDVGKAFLQLAQTPGLAKLVATFRTDLLPALVALVDVTTREFLPVLIPALTEVVKLLINFSGTTGALTKITGAIGGLAESLNKVFAENPGLLKVANNLLTVVAIVSAAGLASGVSALLGFARGLKLIGGILKLVIRPLQFLGRELGITQRLITLLRPAIGLLGRGLLLLAGPVGVVVGLVLAVGAAFAFAWQRSEVFRSAATAISNAVLAIVPGLRLVIQFFSDIILLLTGVGNNFASLGTTIREWWLGVQLILAKATAAFRLWRAGVGVILRAVGAGLRNLLEVFRSWRTGVGIILSAVTELFRTWWAGVRSILGIARDALSGFAGRVRSILGNIDLFNVGERVMGTLLDGLKAGFENIKDFISGIADWIRDHKGPIAADRKLLVPAGKAIMQGFDKGLHQRWAGVKTWVSDIGGFFKGIISGGSINGTIADILLGKGGVGALNNKLSGILGVPPGLIGGAGGFLHPTAGWADTLNQVRLIEKLFHVGMTSGLRMFDTVAGAGVSQHPLGQAADFGNSRASDQTLTKLASFMSRFVGSIFKQVIWLDKLWAGGGPIKGSFVADHMDHVHLGWQGRAAGGGVRKGQPYQWNERGREILVPQQNGYVMNAGRTKELISALRSISRGGNTDNRKVEMHVHSRATDPRAVGQYALGRLGRTFSLA